MMDPGLAHRGRVRRVPARSSGVRLHESEARAPKPFLDYRTKCFWSPELRRRGSDRGSIESAVSTHGSRVTACVRRQQVV